MRTLTFMPFVASPPKWRHWLSYLYTGLTDEEIDVAVRQSVQTLPPHSSPAPPSLPPGRPQVDAVPQRRTSWSSLLFGSVVFGSVVWVVVRLVRVSSSAILSIRWAHVFLLSFQQFLSRWQVQQELQMQQRWQEMQASIQHLQSSIDTTGSAAYPPPPPPPPPPPFSVFFHWSFIF